MRDKKLGQVIAETEKQKEREGEYLVQYTCRCGFEWGKHSSHAHYFEDCPKCDRKSIQGIREEIKRKEKENGAEPIKFFELSITIRAGSIDDIIGLIPRVTGDFISGDERVGSWCGDESNYEFNLSEK